MFGLFPRKEHRVIDPALRRQDEDGMQLIKQIKV